MNILITGGTGLIGKRLTELLIKKGHSVSVLSRSKKQSNEVTYFTWDIEKQTIEEEAIKQADIIVHLAGANVGEGRWTEKRKKEIIDSRIDAGNLLFEQVKQHNPELKAFISSSAIGYYGMVTTDTIFEETDKPGDDFLAKVCEDWENSALQFNSISIKTVIVRTGVVLDKEDGALAKLLTPIKLGIGSALGSGKQAMPWIHLDDICGIYLHLIENESLSGVFNGVAPSHENNKEFSKTVAEVLKKPFWFPNVPAFALKLLMGEQAVIALQGSKISAEKIKKSGYKFKFPELKPALEDILI
ncbi:MAG: TIGR01777 family oxidoreductase [Flavobacteriales bacterium]